MPPYRHTWTPELESVRLLLGQVPPHAERLVVWVSAPQAERRAFQAEVQTQFAQADVQVRSAYKPLIHAVLDDFWEDWLVQVPRRVHLEYPVHSDAHPERFLLEAYPLAGLVQALGATFGHSGRKTDDLNELHYVLLVDGVAHRIPIPCHKARDVLDEVVLRPTGRLTVQMGTETTSTPFPLDIEQCWDAYLKWLRETPWPQQAPFFGVLHIRASLPATDEPLPFDLEHSSLTEALSEEFYFGTLEFFQARAGLGAGSRTLRPRQIVPEVVSGPPGLAVEVQTLTPAPALAAVAPPRLSDLARPLSSAEIKGASSGSALECRSVQGREVRGVLRSGQGRGLLISAGQHANETTGVVAALRALEEINSLLPLAFIPLENPDGYALHEQLRHFAPTHMHHAARYTALGDDLSFREAEPLYEAALRRQLLSEQDALLHLNLHGYPAHEWTRPMTGYIPRGFASWTFPKGFLLILRYRWGWRETAWSLIRQVARDLKTLPDLMALNSKQLQASEAHTSARAYRVLHGTPVILQARRNTAVPLELITEFPDETVYGQRFGLGHEAHLRVVQSAVRWAEQRGAAGGPGNG